MTAVHRTSQLAPLTIPQTENTAPVLEFACLYTHDIRRKQKRWQDGFLRFHTFNRRVMVYDVPLNFIGDAHWKGGEDVGEGDEVMLEREGVVVQVGEGVGRTETDLTELIGKRIGRKMGAGSSSPARSGQQTPGSSRWRVGGTQLKHRSLNALLGTPKGPLGKAALPTKSPFEERRGDAENDEWEEGRPPKRRKAGQAEIWNVIRTTKMLAPAKSKDARLRARTSDAARRRKTSASAEQQRLGTKEVVELSEDEEEPDKFLPGFSSDALAPSSSPAKNKQPLRKSQPEQFVRSSSPVFQTQKPKNGKRVTKTPHVVEEATEKESASTAARQMVSMPKQGTDVVDPGKEKNDPPTGPAPKAGEKAKGSNEHSSSGQTLRLTAKSKKKKTLLCQDQLMKKSTGTRSANTENAVATLLDTTLQHEEPASMHAPGPQRKLLEERLARIRRKSTPTTNDKLSVPDREQRRPDVATDSALQAAAPQAGEPFQDDGTTLAELDQMIMPRAELRVPPKPSRPSMAPPPEQDRQLRKTRSEITPSGPRAPGAPMRFTPSPSKCAQRADSAVPSNKPADPQFQAQPKCRPKRPVQRSVNLNTAANGTSAVIFSKPFQTPKSKDEVKATTEALRQPDAWSREAFDLFEWRPPGWDEEGWCTQADGGRRT